VLVTYSLHKQKGVTGKAVEEKSVMNVDSVAAYLGLSKSTVRKLIKWKEIPYIKIHRRYIFYRTRIDEWLLAISTQPQAPTGEERFVQSSTNKVLTALGRR
jgi:excisionase family DNA binding protein